jgi:uncharacterized membrane protein
MKTFRSMMLVTAIVPLCGVLSHAQSNEPAGKIVHLKMGKSNTFHGLNLGVGTTTPGAASNAAPAAGYTFSTIDYPGSSATVLYRIDNSGRIVGNYGPGVGELFGTYGFLLHQGTFSPVNFPGALATAPFDLSPLDDVVGVFVDAGGNSHGFVLQAGTYTQVDAPGAVGNTNLFAINRRRQIVGCTFASSPPYYTSFLLDRGAFTTLPQYPGSLGTCADDINNSGDIAGTWVRPDTDQTLGTFLLSGGTFTDLQAPLQGTTNCDLVNPFFFQYCNTLVGGLNDRGVMVGAYTANDGTAHGYLLRKGVWTTIDFPGAAATQLVGINDLGQIAGYYYDSGGALHGFVATPQ